MLNPTNVPFVSLDRVAAGLAPALTLVIIGAAASAQAQVSIITGYESSTGRYGATSTTDIRSVPVAVRYDRGPWAFRLGTSWLSITGDGKVLPVISSESDPANPSGRGRKDSAASSASGLLSPVNAAPVRSRSTESGMGDVVLSVIHHAYERKSEGLAIDLTGRVKFGTASAERGLGTGYNDYSIKVDAYQDWRHATSWASLGLKRLGRADDDYLRPVAFASLGGGYRFSARATAGMGIDAASPAREGGKGPAEVSLYIRYRLSDDLRINLEWARGLNDAAADRTLATTLTWYLN